MTKDKFHRRHAIRGLKMSKILSCREEERAEEKKDRKEHVKRHYILFKSRNFVPWDILC